MFRSVNGYMVKRNRTNLMETIYILGIDISKEKFNTALTLDGKAFYDAEIDNTPNSISTFFKELKKQLSSLTKLIVCMEHTGIYCKPVLDFLVKNKISVCVEHALHIKQSQGLTRGKNDKIDARRIATYAFKNRENLVFWKPQRASLQRINALLALRERLVNTQMRLRVPINEGDGFIDPAICKESLKHCLKSIRALEADIKKINNKISELVKEDQKLYEQFKLVTSVPGVGDITALNVIISTNEFTKITDPKKFACYAGVAPFEHTSGSSIRGKTRVSKMANMKLKTLLTMGARSAVVHCDEMKAYYTRKIETGKNKWSVLNAVRNKLITRIFACIRNNRMYEKIHQNALA